MRLALTKNKLTFNIEKDGYEKGKLAGFEMPLKDLKKSLVF